MSSCRMGAKCARLPGTRVLRRCSIDATTRSGLRVTTPAATVIDLADQKGTMVDEAVGLLADAVSRRKATVAELADELHRRYRHRHRAILRIALGAVDAGAQTLLEVKFRERVLLQHGLPEMTMQVGDQIDGWSIRRDFEHEATSTIIEVDGRLGHEGAGRRADYRRDRRAASRGAVTLRADWVDIEIDPCGLAADVVGTLRSRGWVGDASPCSPTCAVAKGQKSAG